MNDGLRCRQRRLTDLPRHEADGFDDRGLDDLLPGEDAPRDGIGALGVCVCPQITTLIDSIVGDITVTLDVREERSKQCRRGEKLQIGLQSSTTCKSKGHSERRGSGQTFWYT